MKTTLNICQSAFSLPFLRRRLCWRGPRGCGRVAITIDDGPEPDITPQVLAILAERNVRATFFMMGEKVEQHAALVAGVRASGHAIGNHGYDHRPGNIPGQVQQCRLALQRQNADTSLLRPPAGRLTVRELLGHWLRGYSVVLWSFDARDSMRHEGRWSGPPPDYTRVRAGDIILMHDDNPLCVRELPRLIDALSENGLQAVTVPELLGDSVRNQ